MYDNKTKNEDPKYSRFVYISAMRYALVLILFIGGSFAFFAFMTNSATQADKAPSAEELAKETSELLKTYPEFADWERQSDRGVSLWLPKTFEQFKVADVLEMTKKNVEDVPLPLRFNIDDYAQLPGELHFVAFDKNSYLSDYIRHFQIISAEAPADMFDDFVGIFAEESSQIKLLQQPMGFKIGRYFGKSVITETQIGFGSFATVYYFIPHSGKFYILGMRSSVGQVDESQAMMEKVMNTLWLYTD